MVCLSWQCNWTSWTAYVNLLLVYRPNVARFFCSYYHSATLAKFYVIHKINKTPKVGRPLLSFTRTSLGLLVYLLIRLSNLKYKCRLCLEILPSWSKHWRTSRTSFFLGEGGAPTWGGCYSKYWALRGALIWSWALIQAFRVNITG